MINVSGMKVASVNPGMVIPAKEADSWKFTIVLNGISVEDNELLQSTSAAKQRMREEVYRLRRVHCLVPEIV